MTRKLFFGALAGAFALQAWLAFRVPVGSFKDDAMHVLLARSLAGFSFALPGRPPASDPLPGFAAILALPVHLVAPHWGWLRWLPLLAGWTAILLSWRLLRRVLPASSAMAGTLLIAFNPVLLEGAGALMPATAFLAAALAVLDALAIGAFRWAAFWAALAGLLSPYGGLLATACAVALWQRRGRREAAHFLVAALTPLAIWSLRNWLVAGTSSGYLDNMAMRWALLDRRWWRAPAVILSSVVYPAAAASVGLAFLIAGVSGAWRLCRASREIWPAAAAIFCSAFLILHCAWGVADPRYVIPVLPLAWLFLLAALPVKPAPRLTAVGLALLICLGADLSLARLRRRASPELWPRTMAWIREQTPADARFQSMFDVSITLFTGRQAQEPPLVFNRDTWLAFCLERRVGYLQLDRAVGRWATLPGPRLEVLRSLPRWAASSPYVLPARVDEEEGQMIFRISHPKPERYLRAMELYAGALRAKASGADASTVKAGLRQAAALEPGLALPWAVLGHLAADFKEKRKFLSRALALDPTLAPARTELESLPAK